MSEDPTLEVRLKMAVVRALAKLGFGKHKALWGALFRVSPRLAGAVVLVDTLSAPAEVIMWAWPGPGREITEEDIEEVVEAVSDDVNRSPTPMGGDDYIIYIARYGAMPGEEENGVDLSKASTEQRPRLASDALAGNRWHDWKQGQGKEELRQALRENAPTKEMPLTTIQVMVAGTLAMQAYNRMT